MKRSRIGERRNTMLRNSIDDRDNIDVRMCKCDIYRIMGNRSNEGSSFIKFLRIRNLE